MEFLTQFILFNMLSYENFEFRYITVHEIAQTVSPRNQLCCMCFTRSQHVALSVHLMVVERKLRGRFGMVLLRLLMLSEKLHKPQTKAALKQHVKRTSLQRQG